MHFNLFQLNNSSKCKQEYFILNKYDFFVEKIRPNDNSIVLGLSSSKNIYFYLYTYVEIIYQNNNNNKNLVFIIMN